MESSALLMTAASGLERYMVTDPTTNKPIHSSVAAQISAAIYYKASVLSKLETNSAFKERFKEILYGQISKDFGLYIDAQARSKPKSLHHVYEWNKVGTPGSRLFNLVLLPSTGLSFGMTYEFQLSKTNVPSKRGARKYKFAEKAKIMEDGTPVRIAPVAAERLVFEMGGHTIFMPPGASVTVSRPGGKAATNQFRLAYVRFFKSALVNESIKKSGFQQIFNTRINAALRVPPGVKKVQYSFSANVIRRQADAALEAAFGGALL